MGLLDKKDSGGSGAGKARADFSNVEGAGKSRADFSNVEGASSSTASGSTAGESAARTYTVVAGDSLSRIAQRELGDASKWRVIYDANRNEIDDPDRIFPGQVLKLPARD
jgi:nucleoid-associated protein YgaU